MCGIIGEINPAGVDASALLRASEGMRHRGPDDSGLYISMDRRVAFAHRRLSIVDLSEASKQPMSSADGRYTIVFNGEIYNFRQLRAELTKAGAVFVSSGDTEVVLAAYLAWGPECLSRLNGMFAFAIHDRGCAQNSSNIFFARDRAGEKPFYYIHDGLSLRFASELKGLDHGRQINLQALNHYLSLGYIPGGLCLFDGVQKLPAAHCGMFDLNKGCLRIWPYWSLPVNRPEPSVEGAQLAEEAGQLLEDSVRLRLIADVPVGVMLSGGLDSSLVVAAAARVSARAVETFTISLPGSSLDEAEHAQKVACYFGTRHHVLPLADASLKQLDGLAPFIDEPIADSSILPAWLVFGLARQHVKVALGGDGGDELFGGYSDYALSMRASARWGWVPSGVWSRLGHWAACLPAGMPGRNRIVSMRGGPLRQVVWGQSYFDPVLRRRLLKAGAMSALQDDLGAPECFLLQLLARGADPLDGMTRMHFGGVLPDDFLVKVDRASMAHSLEVRAPFLDHRLIEFAFGRVPSAWKVQGGQARRLQRMIARQWLPADLDINRKQGFSIPINEWLRAEGEKGLMSRMEGLPDMIDLGEVHALVKGHMAGRTNGGRLFSLLMLALSMRNLSR